MAGSSLKFPGFVRTRGPVLGMIYTREKKFPRRSVPVLLSREDEAPAESMGSIRLGWSLVLPGKYARESGEAGSQN
jgi:hypothetical protein